MASQVGQFTQWWIRPSGSNLNGGGYNPTIAGAGTNYANQDAVQLSLADVVTTGTTTVTSVAGGFTAAMIGNAIRIAGDDYYFITARASSNSITVDRATGTGTGQTGKVGGAFSSLAPFSAATSESFSGTALTTGMVSGALVNITGGGTDDPSTADYSWQDYYQLRSPTINNVATDGGILKIVGFNGRPMIDCSEYGLIEGSTGVLYQHLKIRANLTYNNGYGANYMLGGRGVGSLPTTAIDIIFDQHNYQIGALNGINTVLDCEGRCSAGGGSYTLADPTGIDIASNFYSGITGSGAETGVLFMGNYVHDWIGMGVWHPSGSLSILYNLFANLASRGIQLMTGTPVTIIGNTFYNTGFNSIGIMSAADVMSGTIRNNLIVNSQGYGIAAEDTGTYETDFSTALVLLYNLPPDYNAYYNNASGNYHFITAGPDDVILSANPFNNASIGDFSLNSTAGGGAAVKGAGFPLHYRGTP